MSEAWSASEPVPGVVIHQPADGFRYSAEVFWLVGLVLEGGMPSSALDLGTGSGVMPMLLAAHGVDAVGVDVQARWKEAWERTLQRSRVPGHVELRVEAVQDLFLGRVFDAIVCNPPFFAPGSGPEPADPFKAAARFEHHGGLRDFVQAGLRHLAPGGRLWWAIPTSREGELLAFLPASHRVCGGYRVGRRRSLVLVSDRPQQVEGFTSIPGRGEVVDRWYDLARKRPAG